MAQVEPQKSQTCTGRQSHSHPQPCHLLRFLLPWRLLLWKSNRIGADCVGSQPDRNQALAGNGGPAGHAGHAGKVNAVAKRSMGANPMGFQKVLRIRARPPRIVARVKKSDRGGGARHPHHDDGAAAGGLLGRAAGQDPGGGISSRPVSAVRRSWSLANAWLGLWSAETPIGKHACLHPLTLKRGRPDAVQTSWCCSAALLPRWAAPHPTSIRSP